MSYPSERRLAQLAGQIAERLRPFCSHMTEDQLLGLTTEMARLELKYLDVGRTSVRGPVTGTSTR